MHALDYYHRYVFSATIDRAHVTHGSESEAGVLVTWISRAHGFAIWNSKVPPLHFFFDFVSFNSFPTRLLGRTATTFTPTNMCTSSSSLHRLYAFAAANN